MPAEPGALTQRQLLGADRVLEPQGALPQAAERLDATTPPAAWELGVAVHELNLDATSHRQLEREHEADPERMAAAIAAIVAQRGKMQNPVTGSGGVLLGEVTAVGPDYPAPRPAVGDRIVSVASLTTTPLRLEAVGPLDPASPQIPVRGTAVLGPRMPWAPLPDDLPLPLALAALDVYGAPSHAAALAAAGDHVLVLGAGRAGLLTAAAARRAVGPDGHVTAMDVSPAAVARATEAAGADAGIVADLTDPLAASEALAAAGRAPADLTVVCVDVPRCEASAALLTVDGGNVLLFSMATDFRRAALGAEAFSSGAQLIVGNGFAPDRGALILDLLREDDVLRDAFAALEAGS